MEVNRDSKFWQKEFERAKAYQVPRRKVGRIVEKAAEYVAARELWNSKIKALWAEGIEAGYVRDDRDEDDDVWYEDIDEISYAYSETEEEWIEHCKEFADKEYIELKESL